jgi:hypothetical protein
LCAIGKWEALAIEDRFAMKALAADDRVLTSCAATRIAVVALLVASSHHATPLLAHDAASWVQNNPEYVDRLGRHCCGPQDCERIPESYIREEGDEIVVLPTRQRFRKGVHGTYPSIDSDWWWCKERPMPWMNQSTARCIFFPFLSQ